MHVLVVLSVVGYVCQYFVAEIQAKPEYFSQFSVESGLQISEPRIFAENIISNSDYERGGTFTPDGKEFYFTKRSPEGYFMAICVSRFVNSKWSQPEIAPFSGQYPDSEPIISPDGEKLFFTSRRPVNGKPKQDPDLWVMNKTAIGWSEPVNLGAPINTDSAEGYATVTKNGTLYFHSTRTGGKGRYDIYRSKFADGKYAPPENLGATINTEFFEGFPFIAPDENFLLFVSIERPDEIVGDGSTYHRGDLYFSSQKNGIWTEAKHLNPPFNSAAAESCPFISPDGKYFFFTSERGFMKTLPKERQTFRNVTNNLKTTLNGLGNIYQVDIKVLEREF